jgi:hypothetical protein
MRKCPAASVAMGLGEAKPERACWAPSHFSRDLLQPIDQSEILVNEATSRVPIDQLLGIGQLT